MAKFVLTIEDSGDDTHIDWVFDPPFKPGNLTEAQKMGIKIAKKIKEDKRLPNK